MFQGAGFNPNLSVALSSVVTSLLAPSASSFITAPRLSTVAPALLDDTVAIQRPWAALFMQPDLAATARRFAPLSPIRLSGHPEGKGVGDYIEPTPSRSDRDRDADSPRRSGNSGSSGSTDKSPDYNRDTGRSGGSSEKRGFAGVGDDEADSIIWNLLSLAEIRPDDAPAEKDGGNPDREGTPAPAPRDPSGELNPRRGEVDPGVSWGGGGGDGFGDGPNNDGLSLP